jgi:hypothetical protein
MLVNLNDLDVQDVETRKLDFSICEFSDNADDRLIKSLMFVRRKKTAILHSIDIISTKVRYIFSGEIEYGPLKMRAG